MLIQLQGKSAVVSGSTAGIGFAIAKSLLSSGAQVVINGRTQDRVNAALAALSAHGDRVQGVAADLATAAGVARLIEAVPQADILINNVGIVGGPRPFVELSDQEWQYFFDMNVMSGIRLARHYVTRMREQGWGRIIFISSDGGLNPPAELVHYAMTKTAQLTVSRGLAASLAATGVTVNAVVPGPTATEAAEGLIAAISAQTGESADEILTRVRPSSLIRRWARAEEVANLVTYLASDLSSATTGAALRVDGGVTPTII